MKAKLILITMLLPVVMMIAGTGLAFADSPEITSVEVYNDYQEANDWLVVMTVNCSELPYSPYYDAGVYWEVQLIQDIGGVNTSVANANLNDWGMRPISIYISEAQASAYTIGSTNFSVRLQAKYNASIMANQSIESVDWKGDNSIALKAWAIGQVAAIGVADQGDADYYLITDAEYGKLLTLEGGSIFKIGVPGIDSYIPGLFAIIIQELGVTTTSTHDITYATGLEDWETNMGVPFSGLINDTAALAGIGGGMLGGIAFLIIAIVVMTGGVALGHASAGVLGGCMFIITGALLGFIPLVLIAMPALIMAFMFVKSFWWSRA